MELVHLRTAQTAGARLCGLGLTVIINQRLSCTSQVTLISQTRGRTQNQRPGTDYRRKEKLWITKEGQAVLKRSLVPGFSVCSALVIKKSIHKFTHGSITLEKL